MKVALYVRVSTDEQKLNGYSTTAQLDELKKYAKKEKLEVYKEYIDDGYSGGSINRPALNNLLEDVKKDKLDMILFVKLDRWFRSVAHYYKIQEVLDEHNVSWCATQEDYETTTSSGKFKVNVMLSVSQQFKDATSERVNSVFDYKIYTLKEVVSGKKTLGYDIVNKHYVINEEEADIIRRLFDNYLETQCLRETHRWYRENIGELDYQNIKRRLTNVRYNGKYPYKGELIDDVIPKIIDDETFNKVQELIKMNMKSPVNKKNIFIYKGITYCGICGGKAHGNYNITRNINYYRCSNVARYKCTCNKMYNERTIEKIVLNKIMEIANGEYIKIKKIESMPSKEKSKIKLNESKIKSKITRLQELYIDNLIDKDEYKLKYEELQKQLNELKEPVEKVNNKEELKFLANGDFLDMYNKLDKRNKQLFNRKIIKKITFYSKENIDVELYY